MRISIVFDPHPELGPGLSEVIADRPDVSLVHKGFDEWKDVTLDQIGDAFASLGVPPEETLYVPAETVDAVEPPYHTKAIRVVCGEVFGLASKYRCQRLDGHPADGGAGLSIGGVEGHWHPDLGPPPHPPLPVALRG